MNKQKVIVYVDGFNFYNGLKSKKWKKYYWLDVVSFFEEFMRPHQELIEVYYFSAIPLGNSGKADRQDLFFSCNKLSSRFKLILGKYAKKSVPIGNGKSISTYEEKETDVRIAVQMISDVVSDKCDVSILVSADSDLIPPIEFIRAYKPVHKVIVYFPPNRSSLDLLNMCGIYQRLERFEQKFSDNMLADSVELPNGYIAKRPAKWK